MSFQPSVDGLVPVYTAIAVIKRVNLLNESNALALDIGGSLAKLLYFQRCEGADAPPRLAIDLVGGSPARYLSVYVPSLEGRLHFFAFETRNIEQLLDFMHEHWLGSTAKERHGNRCVRATGGGAYKYSEIFESSIGIKLTRLDEMTCVVAGLNFLLTAVDMEVYAFKQPTETDVKSEDQQVAREGAGKRKRKERPRRRPQSRLVKPPLSMENARDFVPSQSDPFPYLLVNIGSGVSIVKVTGHGAFERVSGSSLGGGTFWGLARLLLNCKTFDDVISLTNGADNSNVDMLVGDIYGGAYTNLGLDPDVIAASFGKVTMRKDQPNSTSFRAAWRKFVKAIRGTISLWIYFWLAVPVIGTILRLFGVESRIAHSLANLSLTALFRPEDVALSLLRMVSYNIGQIAYLNARVHNLERIYFGGNFIRDHPYTIADISFAVNFWSSGRTQALFLRHDGYLGAIGAFLGGSSMPSPPRSKKEVVGALALNQSDLGGSNLKTNGTYNYGIAQHDATANPIKYRDFDPTGNGIAFHDKSESEMGISDRIGEMPLHREDGDRLDLQIHARSLRESATSAENGGAKRKSRRRKKSNSAILSYDVVFENGSELLQQPSAQRNERSEKSSATGFAPASGISSSASIEVADVSDGEWKVVQHRRRRAQAESEIAV